MEPNRSGNSGRYLRVLNWLSEYGLSSETWGSAMGFCHAQIGQHQRHRLRGHRGSSIRVYGQRSCGDALFLAGCRDQPLGQFGRFAGSYHPAHHIAAEDIEDDIEMEVGPFGWAQQLGYIPTPDLIGPGGQQLRLGVLRMPKLVATLLQFAVFSQDAMHGAYRAEINAFIDQGCIDLCWSLVTKTLRVQMIEHGPALSRIQCPRRRGTCPAWGRRQHAPIERRTRHPEGATGDRFADAVA